MKNKDIDHQTSCLEELYLYFKADPEPNIQVLKLEGKSSELPVI